MSASPKKKVPGYETTFILRPDSAEATWKSLKERLSGAIEKFGGEIVKVEEWGRRKLAYTIQKETQGYYIYMIYQGQPGVVTEFERMLKLTENVLRFLTVKLDDEFDAEEYFSKKAAKKEAAPKEKQDEDEEDKKMLGRELKRMSRIYTDPDFVIDYKNPKVMQTFVSEMGKIAPRRKSGNNAFHQREVTRAVKRARQIAIVGYISPGY